MPTIKVLSYVMGEQLATVMLTQVLLLGPPLGNPVQEIVTVGYIRTILFALSDIGLNASSVAVRMKETGPGRLFNLTVDNSAGFEIASGQKVELTVKSNHPKYPLIQVPVFVPQSPAQPQARGVAPMNETKLDKPSSRSGAKK